MPHLKCVCVYLVTDLSATNILDVHIKSANKTANRVNIKKNVTNHESNGIYSNKTKCVCMCVCVQCHTEVNPCVGFVNINNIFLSLSLPFVEKI